MAAGTGSALSSFGGLSPVTQYTVHVALRDAAGNLNANVFSADFATKDLTGPVTTLGAVSALNNSIPTAFTLSLAASGVSSSGGTTLCETSSRGSAVPPGTTARRR